MKVWQRVGIVALVVILATGGVLELVLTRAEPLLRARLVQSLSTRFHSRVEMGAFSVSLIRGFQVSGQNLAIFPNNIASSTPTISVRRFAFRTGYRSLFRSPMQISHVDVDGLRIHLPPRSQRKELPGAGEPANARVSVFVDELDCTDTVLTLGTDKPGKVAKQFVIRSLNLRSVGRGKPLEFTAQLTNPKPVGQIASHGYFGPWDAAHPGDTVVGGAYSFQHADLGTIKGIGGMLSSTGEYKGTLDKIVVDGTTDTPDFRVAVSGHKVPLHTEFHAIVDGLDGNTYLQPVKAHFLHSYLTARGFVVQEKGQQGRRVSLDVVIDQARIEDLLRLGVRTDPPVLEGPAKVHTHLEIAPGTGDVAHRLGLQGTFAIANARFSNEKMQRRVDEISLRSQGQVELLSQHQRDQYFPVVQSQMSGDFRLAEAQLSLTNIRYAIPGATIKLAGVYGLDGARFNLTGTADMQATISRMVGGWRGMLLVPVDKYFQKSGAGTEVPFKIDGTKADPHFALDFDKLKKH